MLVKGTHEESSSDCLAYACNTQSIAQQQFGLLLPTFRAQGPGQAFFAIAEQCNVRLSMTQRTGGSNAVVWRQRQLTRLDQLGHPNFLVFDSGL